jgi:hypothetical protein
VILYWAERNYWRSWLEDTPNATLNMQLPFTPITPVPVTPPTPLPKPHYWCIDEFVQVPRKCKKKLLF